MIAAHLSLALHVLQTHASDYYVKCMSPNLKLSLTKELLTDALIAIGRRGEADARTRREILRTVFASCEGLAWVFRSHVADVARMLDELNDDEAFALSEVQYTAVDNGKVVQQPRFLSVTASVRLTAKIAERLNGGYSPDFGGTHYEAFRRFVAIRNRLTHPKSINDMAVTEDELHRSIASFFWLLDLVLNGMDAANAALKQHNLEFHRLFDELETGDPEAWAEYKSIEAKLRQSD